MLNGEPVRTCACLCVSCDASLGLSSTGTGNLVEENFYTFLGLSDVFLRSSWFRYEIFTRREGVYSFINDHQLYSMLLSLNDRITFKDTACALQTQKDALLG